jgi:predicted short-subunit dehydrogenase-like oxidoreductase (DUF2520 family)
MIKIAVIGSGNVAQHLVKAFSKSPHIKLVQVFSRRLDAVLDFGADIPIVHDLQALVDADLYIIAVSDGAVAEVSAQLPFSGKLVVHASGALPLSAIDAKNRRGVFYPVQTFSKNKALDLSEVPICLEAESEKCLDILREAALAISSHLYLINSKQRKSLHLAAVFVSNFSNHMYALGEDICNQAKIPFDILKPLISETAHKITVLSPKEAQTGPAKRNDAVTITTHMEQLQDENLQNIYITLTESIQQYGKKL